MAPCLVLVTLLQTHYTGQVEALKPAYLHVTSFEPFYKISTNMPPCQMSLIRMDIVFKVHGFAHNCSPQSTFTLYALLSIAYFQDVEGWSKLCEKLSEKCYIMGDGVYPRPERLIQEGFGELHSSAVVLKLQRLTTVSDVLHAAKVAKGMFS